MTQAKSLLTPKYILTSKSAYSEKKIKLKNERVKKNFFYDHIKFSICGIGRLNFILSHSK